MYQYKSINIILIVLASILFSKTSLACSCAPASVSERFDEVEYVFSAEIIAAELMIEPGAKIRSSGDQIQIKLGSRQDFKNDSSHLEYLYTSSGGSSCGIAVIIGATHTFLVNEGGRVSLCGSTIDRDEGKAFYQLLKDRDLLK